MTTTVGYYKLGDTRYQLRTARLSVVQRWSITVGNLRDFLADAEMADLPNDTWVRIESAVVQIDDGPPSEAVVAHRVTIEAAAHIAMDPMEET